MNVAFLGLGTMGMPLAEHLAKKHDVRVWNRTEKAFPKGTVVKTPKETTTADVMFTCVSNDEALREVLFGKNGVFSGTLNGKVLVDCSTISVDLAKEIAEKAQDAGCAFLDAPITGSKVGAENGTTMFMVGGEKAVYQKCLPLLQAMGSKFVYCGQSTYGQRAKLALNLTQALMLESYLEGCTLAMKNGVSLAVIEEILENSGAKSNVSSFKLPYIKKRDFSPHFKAGLMLKDLRLAQQEWEKLRITLPLAEQIAKVYENAPENEDMSAIVKTLEKNEGIDFR